MWHTRGAPKLEHRGAGLTPFSTPPPPTLGSKLPRPSFPLPTTPPPPSLPVSQAFLGQDLHRLLFRNAKSPFFTLPRATLAHPPFSQAIHGEDITVYGEGNQTRSFCFVDDLVDGLMRLMNQEETIGPVNIGNPGEFTIKQV